MSKHIKGKLINYGFQTPELKIEDHIFGGGYGDAVVINPSGQWDSAKPLYEAQADNFETQGCTVWGTENALEFLHKFKFGTEKNYEELPPYIGAGLRPESGGDPNKVAQWIHENGLIEEPAYQFPTTLEELKSLLGKPVRSDIIAECKKWPYEFRHQWVLQGVSDKRQRMDAIKGALQYGVLGVSVTAWFKNEEGVYIDNGMRNTHWCVCYGWTDKGWKIFDSYDQSEKIYSFDSVISFAKLYFLEKKLTQAQKQSIWDLVRAFLFGQPEELKRLERILKPEPITPNLPVVPPKSPTVWLSELCKASIGLDLSVQAPNELGCADSLSRLIGKIFPDFPSFLSTIALNSHLASIDKRFKRCGVKPWVIIVSPTVGGNIGHCGILGDNDVIYSNNSKTGKWDKHWTLKKWIAYYRTQKGLQILLYELK